MNLELSNIKNSIEDVINLVMTYRFNLNNKDIVSQIPYEKLKDQLYEPVPVEGTDLKKVLESVEMDYIPGCTKVGHPHFLAWMNNSSCDAGMLGEMINLGLNQVPFTFKGGKSATIIEHLVPEWFCSLFDYGENSSGNIVSGGTVANLTALAVARETMNNGVMENGLGSLNKPLRIYASAEVHISLERAVGLLGIGTQNIVKIPTDANYRMDVIALENAIKKDAQKGYLGFCVVAQAGSSTVGAIDPIDKIADICKRHQLWLHVDAAYGGGAILTDYGKKRFEGINRADSITTDPHKWFYMPVESGLVLFKDKGNLTETFLKSSCSSYRGEMDSVNRMNNGIQIAQASKAFKVWFSFKVYGVKAIGLCVEKDLLLAKKCKELFEETGKWDVVNPVDLSILCCKYKKTSKSKEEIDKLHENVLDEYEKSGKGLLTKATVGGETCIRICFANHRTELENVKRLVADLTDIADILSKKAGI